jgi:hypothetical protein
LTWLIVLLTASVSFAFGWVACSFTCSKRSDCPRYSAYALAKWKRDLEVQVSRHEKRSPRSSTPPEGSGA